MTTMGILAVLVIVLALCPSQTMTTPISVQIQIQPQLSSCLGFYDTLFPLYFTITITNNQANRMPAGNLTLHIEAPSEGYSSWYLVPFPAIESHASATERDTLVPTEAGLYTFHLDSYDTPAGRISLAGFPLHVVDLRGPEALYGALGALAVVVSAIVAVVALAPRKRREYSMKTVVSIDETTILAPPLSELRNALSDFSQFEEALIYYATFQNKGYERILEKMGSKLPNVMAGLKAKYFGLTKPVAGELDPAEMKLKRHRAISTPEFIDLVGKAKTEIDKALEESNA